MINTLILLGMVAAAFSIAVAALVAFGAFERRKSGGLRKLARDERDQVVFLFDGNVLVDASDPARQLLDTAPDAGSEWLRLAGLLRPRFCGLDDLEEHLADKGEVSLTANDTTTRLDAVWRDGLARIRLTDDMQSEQMAPVDRHALAAMQNELDTLRSMAEYVPFPSWRENERGEIIWANQAYLDITEAVHPDTAIQPWPPARLFGDAAESGKRVKLTFADSDAPHWFTLHRAQIGNDTLYSADPADDAVRAESALSEFVTTLTKTFAQLPIGLAIFDRDRKLSLFNPALTDLTMLPAEFLCGQPTLFAFLDRLRDKRMMPEPKDYKTWRRQMSELEEKAVGGSYLETWFLPTGQTYRVTGRPHPDGAVAFLFEDITAEISLTRRFRAELEMGQAALDALDDAVAVFSSSGVLAMSNDAYAQLWGIDPSTSLGDVNVADATAGWHRKCNPTPVWRQLRGFVSEQGARKQWRAPVTLKDGRTLSCRFVPLAQGGTMATFALPRHDIMPAAEAAPALAAAER